MTRHPILQLKPSVTLAAPAPGEIHLTIGSRDVVTLADQPAAVIDAVAALARDGASQDELNEQVVSAGGVDALLRWRHALGLLLDANVVAYRFEEDGRWIATVEPLVAGVEGVEAAEPAAGTSPGAPRLSRFAYLRRDGDRIVLESPHAPVRITLAPAAVIAICALGRTAPPSSSVERTMLALLGRWQFLEIAESDEDPAVSTWEFHDALFHRASRPGRGGPAGATYRMRDRLPPWPAVKPRGHGPRIALERPDMNAVAAADRSFRSVVEQRRSIRSAESVLSLGELSEFLFRTFHVQSLVQGEPIDAIRRALPSGGGLHELEAYIAVGACDGLTPGCYWYDAHAHALETLSHDEALTSAFVDQAVQSWARRYPPPDVLITLAARVPRVAWQYEAMAYRLILLNVGAAMQLMYLVATAIGLAPCAIGNGDPALFATLTGANPFQETSVGEFALSGRRVSG